MSIPETYLVYMSTDSTSAPVAVAPTWDAAGDLADSLNKVMPALFYVDRVTDRGQIPRCGYYRDADNITMTREIDNS